LETFILSACFKHAENNVHVRRAGFSLRTCTSYMHAVHVRRTCIVVKTPF